MGHLTEAQYRIIADRMIEEHRKYGDRLSPGHWAEVAARKVASHMADFREGERVYTESEVKAMMRTITHCTGSPVASIHINEVRRVFAEEHGIVLDPA